MRAFLLLVACFQSEPPREVEGTEPDGDPRTAAQEVPEDDASGFRLVVCPHPFPGYEKKLTWLRGDRMGNWYRLDEPPMEGWICPAMFRYYETAPSKLYVMALPNRTTSSLLIPGCPPSFTFSAKAYPKACDWKVLSPCKLIKRSFSPA